MASLLIGFVAMVLVPALVLSMIMTKLNKSPVDYSFRDDNLKFTISTDAKPSLR